MREKQTKKKNEFNEFYFSKTVDNVHGGAVRAQLCAPIEPGATQTLRTLTVGLEPHGPLRLGQVIQVQSLALDRLVRNGQRQSVSVVDVLLAGQTHRHHEFTVRDRTLNSPNHLLKQRAAKMRPLENVLVYV